jgi:hypothetical protein
LNHPKYFIFISFNPDMNNSYHNYCDDEAHECGSSDILMLVNCVTIHGFQLMVDENGESNYDAGPEIL